VLEQLQTCTFDDNNRIVDNEHIAKIREAIPDKKQQGLAMKFAAFVLDEVAEVGQSALQLGVPFDEKKLLEENKTFIFDMPSITKQQVIMNTDKDVISGIPGADIIAATAVPGKPSAMFF
jgi:hypothetical protein